MGNGLGFVARRNDDSDARPFFKWFRVETVFEHAPKMSARQEKINPGRQRNRGEESRWQRHALFCNKAGTERYAISSARMGRRRILFPVAAKIALHIAGATTGNPGSPMPVGSSWLMTTRISVF